MSVIKITHLLDYGLNYLVEKNPRREPIPNAGNLNRGFYHKSYSFQRNGLCGLSFYLQPSESGYLKRERKGGLSMHASIPTTLLSLQFSFTQSFYLFFLSSCFLLPILSYLLLLLFLFLLLLFMATPFYTIFHYRIYPFCPSTVFGFLSASLQNYPLPCRLPSHYLYPECVGCTTLHFQTKLLVLFLTSLCFCFTPMDKD